MASIQALDECHSLKEEWDRPKTTLFQSIGKGHSPKEAWGEPNIALFLPLGQPKV